MSVNGPLKGPGGPAPLTPDAGTSIVRPAGGVAPQRPVASARPQAAGGPPVRSNSLPPGASLGNAAPRGAVPQRRATLPSNAAAPWAAHAMFPNGMPQGLMPQGLMPQGLMPHQGTGQDPMKALAQHVESLTKKAEELVGKMVETANKAADGVKDAVSPPSA